MDAYYGLIVAFTILAVLVGGDWATADIFDLSDGVDTPLFWDAARHLSDTIFSEFESQAVELFGASKLSLVISGGCGLNCEWNERWRRSDVFSSVFVPPCANDSGSAIGNAVDALVALGEPCRLQWSVYAGAEFEIDEPPPSSHWRCTELDVQELAQKLSDGEIVAWIQGRAEIGPRALGHRSILASPLDATMRERLNALKGRERYRPIAPCCRESELPSWFSITTRDPFMLFFADVVSDRLPAVTHADNTARVQSVNSSDNERLDDPLGAMARQVGCGVLCNTSLNFTGRGFINRASDLTAFCAQRSINTFVINDACYQAI